MWYNLLFDSILGVVQGKDDPYSWTTGSGCGYDLGGERFSYTNQTEKDILRNASRLIYNIDEGAQFGPVNGHLLIGGANPAIGEYSFDNPLETASTFQTLYASLIATDIVNRVQNCQRPIETGGPIVITEEDAATILGKWKEAFEDSWNRGWNDDGQGEVQFVSFTDDIGGALGSVGRVLDEVTLDSGTLLAISIFFIALFSVLFLFSTDKIESRVLVTLVGVGLVVLSLFAGLGFGLIIDIKVG